MTSWLLRKFPLFVVGSTTLASLYAIVRGLLNWPDPLAVVGTVLATLHLLWLAAELLTSVRSSTSTNAESDRGTVYAYGLARVAVVVTACVLPSDWTEYQPWMAALPVLFAAAVGLRLVAIRTLGRFYSHRVRALDDHEVVTSGPYRLVRHPAYLGMGAANAVFVLFFLNTASAAALVVLLIPTMLMRIVVEERVLLTLPGYQDYANSHRRLVPGIW
ncbi:protein-S-isoprenylcysteine O-methyltransferase Ste14 [Crossiella equi]|uniref:Protein-S-isoprenylcysteine O-methyltransferase Ste14 n=1 Tax=Crossiella equi TaxID=130796 RepID=A0ABS5ARZ1_9PSEU|nr:isoprenylcysteine carboxylmethyltransferase family protein [Crossiella equi]MBP2479157.1 protein-S-isoprenylcysteine O-methyltransferase Ste14 [Crossiella equi]